MKRKLGIGAGAIISLTLLAGCSEPSSPWQYKSEPDPINGGSVISATYRHTWKDNEKAVTDVEISCKSTGSGAATPANLLVKLTAYNNAGGDEFPGSPIVSDAIEYRLDPGTSVEIERDLISSDKYSNVLEIPFLALLFGQEYVVTHALGQFQDSLTSLVGDDKNSGSAGKQIQNIYAQKTQNYKWIFKSLFVRFNTDLGALLISAPVDDPNVLKVAEACGWSANPKAPVAPSAVAVSPQAATTQPDEAQPADAAIADPANAAANAALADEPTAAAADAALPATAVRPTAVNNKPSFDCSKASASVEHMICSDSKLAGLDRELAKLNGEARRAGFGSTPEWIAGGRAWLKSRNACTTTACVAAAYDHRIEQLGINLEQEPE